jgi:chromosome segregation ATPase
MNDPKRYSIFNPQEQENPNGAWVHYADYARLKAEVERLTKESDIFEKCCEHQKNRIERLKAEVERLTERLGGVRLIVTEEMYDELNTKYLEQQHELQNIALTARQILDEKIDLKEQVERLTKQNALATPRHLIASQDITSLREQVERLTKAVMHSPAAQLKLKELEGKTTFDEINPKTE